MTRPLKVALFLALCLLAVSAGFYYRTALGVGREAVCKADLYNLLAAATMYAGDNDGYLPPGDRWVSALSEYIRDPHIQLRCPEDHSTGYSSYAINSAVAGTRFIVPGPGLPLLPAGYEGVVLFFETAHPGDNPAGGRTDVVSPPRHPDGNCYGLLPWGTVCTVEPPPFELSE